MLLVEIIMCRLTYRGQKVTILSEGSVSMSMTQFLNVFDPKKAHSVNSRNEDKPWYSRYCLFSSSNSLEQFICDMWMKEVKSAEKNGLVRLKNPPGDNALRWEWIQAYEKAAGRTLRNRIVQIRRRFPINVEIVPPRSSQGKAKVKVYILDYHINNDTPDGEHLYIDGDGIDRYSGGCGKVGNLFKLFGELPWEPDSPDCINAVVDMILRAETEYYRMNKHSVNPDTVPIPEIAV